MKIYDKFSSEVETLSRIIRYIEVCCFEEEYQKTSSILEEPLRAVGDVYSDNVEFIEELKLKCQIAKDVISVQHVSVEELDEKEENISRLLATIDMIDITLNSNIYRQSFISLFSIFDAYVFDFLKTYFINNVGELETFFKSEERGKLKITFEKAVTYDNIEALKNSFVEEKFDGKYIRQILELLQKHKQQVFDGIDYARIVEMVNRRNIHIHNQGLADARYVEKFNIDGLEIGSYAQISKQYFVDSASVLEKFIKNLEIEYST